MEGNDGTYYAAAGWPIRDLWSNRSNPEPAAPQASQTMG